MPGMRYQPQGLARVAGGGVASGMVFSVQAGTGLRELVRGLPVLGRGANQAVRAFPGGLAFDCRGVATAGYVSVAGEAAALGGNQTIILDMIFSGAPAGSGPSIGGIWRTTAQNDALFAIDRSSADNLQVNFRIGPLAANRVFSPVVSSLYGQRLIVAASIVRGLGRSIWLRIASEGQIIFDQEVSYSTSGSADVPSTGTEYLSIGPEQVENPTRNPNCIIYAQHHLGRVVSADEVASLSRMPWQVYQAIDDEDDGVAAAVERRLIVGPASLDLAASQVGMRVARRLRAQPAALAVAGLGITLRAGRRMQVLAAPLALAGGQVKMQYAHAPLPGSYTLSVSAAAMTLGGGAFGMRVSRRLPVVGARLQLAAGAARALVGRRLIVAPVPLAMSAGQVAARAARRMRTSPAALALVGGNVQLRYSSQIEYARAPAGSGYAPQRAAISARPAQTGGHRPPAIQEATR